MIYGDPYEFAIDFDLTWKTDDGRWQYGAFNFIIDGKYLPGTVADTTYSSMRYLLCACIDDMVNAGELGERIVDLKKMDVGEEENIVDIETGELDQEGVLLWLGYSGDEERLFYSGDLGQTYKEKRLPRGTVESVIRSLPKPEDL